MGKNIWFVEDYKFDSNCMEKEPKGRQEPSVRITICIWRVFVSCKFNEWISKRYQSLFTDVQGNQTTATDRSSGDFLGYLNHRFLFSTQQPNICLKTRTQILLLLKWVKVTIQIYNMFSTCDDMCLVSCEVSNWISVFWLGQIPYILYKRPNSNKHPAHFLGHHVS